MVLPDLTVKIIDDPDGDWLRVVSAAECEPCDMCEEPVCWICEEHYADCPCPGPHQDDEYEYEEFSLPEGNLMFARKLRKINGTNRI